MFYVYKHILSKYHILLQYIYIYCNNIYIYPPHDYYPSSQLMYQSIPCLYFFEKITMLMRPSPVFFLACSSRSSNLLPPGTGYMSLRIQHRPHDDHDHHHHHHLIHLLHHYHHHHTIIHVTILMYLFAKSPSTFPSHERSSSLSASY